MKQANRFARQPDPTLDEIAATCREIQAGWSEADRRARAGGSRYHVPHWMPPGTARDSVGMRMVVK